MKRKAIFNIAASSLIIASTMVGCSGAALNTRAGTSAGKLAVMADSQAHGAEQAIADKDAGRAIHIAEAAVAADPDKPEYRTLLGRAYLLDGRFDSARTAFEDALTLGSKEVRAIVNLSLVHTAQGRAGDARQVLVDHIDVLPAADYGLAMAMAGHAEEAVRVLSQAIHDPAATARERQNLAYSYALAGRWTEARQMAAVDLPPLDAAKRVLGWAQFAQPGAESQRVLAMMGVSPRIDDAGLPVRLALATPELNAPIYDAPTLSAETDIAPSSPAIDESPAEMAELDMMEAVGRTVEDIAASVPAAKPAAAQAPAEPEPASPFLRAKPAMLAKADVPASRPASSWQPVDPDRGSAWVVQLGAFSSSAAAQAGWKLYQSNIAMVGAFPLVSSNATVGGREFYRVAVAGFAGRSDASAFCVSLRGKGGKCFVRQGGAEAAPAKWALALKKSQQIAMR